MLISHGHKFITIDIQKTGTRSMRATLMPSGIIDIVGRPDVKINDPGFSQHGTAQMCKKEFDRRYIESVGTDWNWHEYFKYSIVRNPWKRYVSLLLYRKEKAEEYNNTSAEQKSTWDQPKLKQGQVCSSWAKLFETDKQRFVNSIETFHPQQQMLCDETVSV